MKRRNFIKKASVTGLGLVAVSSAFSSCAETSEKKEA
ncbi:MAG: N4-(beta-N-acetylglucosaminyl)-L-asparaginase, partial [Polaribacter sp.]